MKKKKYIIMIIATVFTVSFVVSSAWAGSPQQYRWEGVAIGVGAVIVGSALLNNCLYAHPPVRVVYRHVERPRHGFYSPSRYRAHWSVEKRWGPNRSRRVWNPGHYNRRGR
ncbi:MAG: hypothetical protein P8012_17545 [Desulfobacterales bacterium]